jgi:hypothetical protein
MTGLCAALHRIFVHPLARDVCLTQSAIIVWTTSKKRDMHPQLRPVAINAVAQYMGVAAEFVVDDALAELAKAEAFSGKEEYQHMYFFVCLGKQLPPEVPYVKIKETILKALDIRA